MAASINPGTPDALVNSHRPIHPTRRMTATRERWEYSKSARPALVIDDEEDEEEVDGEDACGSDDGIENGEGVGKTRGVVSGLWTVNGRTEDDDKDDDNGTGFVGS
jgi:hypothetical protein